MKVLLINGSPRIAGNTARALQEAAAALQAEGVEAEVAWIGNKEIRGCIACGICGKKGDNRCVFDSDPCNELIQKAAAADGLIVGSPVYYAGAAGSLIALLDRMFYAGGRRGRGSARRGYRGGRPDQQVLPDQFHARGGFQLLEHHLRPHPRRSRGRRRGAAHHAHFRP